MSVKNYTVSLCNRNEIKEFIETYHYSKNINGLKSNYCFKMLDNNNLIGAMMYGQIGMAGVWKKYVDTEKDLIELRRLCCVDDTPKNTESYFIGYTLRWLRDKWELEGNNTDILDVVQSPYKFVDEMKEYRENVTYN